MDKDFVHSMIQNQILSGYEEAVNKNIKEENERRKQEYNESMKDFEYLKERLVRQIKMIYALQTTIGVFSSELQSTYSQILKKGVDKKKLGALAKSIEQMESANNIYNKMLKSLLKVWEYSGNRKEIDEFTNNTLNTMTDILVNASRCNTDGSYKKDFSYVALVPQEDLKALDEWYGTISKNKKKDDKIIEVI